MAGQYGNAKTTSRNLELVRVDEENNLLLVRGAVPATAERLRAGHRRLTAADAMGELFKVLAICRWPATPPGFDLEEARA